MAALAGLTSREREDVEQTFLRSRTLSHFDREAVAALIDASTLLELEENEVLFPQGSPADAVFLPLSGSLNAVAQGRGGAGKFVGTILPGETIGEMGVVTGEPRSLSVVGREKARLLKIPGGAFLAASKANGSVLFEILQLVVRRSQETIRALAPTQQQPTLVLVPATGHATELKLLRDLQEAVAGRPQVAYRPAGPAGPAAGDPRVLQLIGLEGEEPPQFDPVLHQADAVLLVAATPAAGGELTRTAARLTDARGLFTGVIRDLVVVHPAGWGSSGPWRERLTVRRIFQVRSGRGGDLRRLLRFLHGKQVSLVLSGGGIRGWAHLGAIRALLEAGVPIDAIGGSSIGSVVAAAYARAGPDLETVRKYFLSMTQSINDSMGVTNLSYPIVSLLNGKKWTRAVESICGEALIEDLPVPFFAVSLNITSSREVVHRTGRLFDAVRASTSLPGLIPPMVIGGDLHVDGGIANNLPVDTMQEIIGEAGQIVSVELSGFPFQDAGRTVYHFPPVLTFSDALLARLGWKGKDLKLAPMGEVLLGTFAQSSLVRTKQNLERSHLAIQPAFPGIGFLTTRDPGAVETLGYEATQRQLAECADLVRDRDF